MGLISRVSSRTYRCFLTMTDENIGPLPPSFMGLHSGPSSDLKVKNIESEDASKFEEIRESFSKKEQDEFTKNNPKPTERQEWMLGPGVSGKISVANAMKNRGFRQEGSGDKRDSNVQYQDPEKLAILQQESAKLQKELDAYNKKRDRCESMLDR